MIATLLRKDGRLLAPMAALVVGIQIALEIVSRAGGLIEGSAVALELERPLRIAWFLSIAALTIAVVQNDPLPGADQDWLIRPIRRRTLLIEKLLFIALTVFAPMLLINLAHVLAEGFSLGAALGPLLLKCAYLFAFLVLPLAALAATTRSMTELAIQGAGLMVVYVAGTALAALLLGVHRCPTCDTGLKWMENLVQHAVTAAGALVILAIQYRRRATLVARAIALTGAALLAFLQLPWAAGYELQRVIDGGELRSESPRDSQAHSRGVRLAPATGVLETEAAAPEHSISGHQASRALWRGEVDPALEYLSHRGGGGGSALLEVPLRIEGLAPGAVLLVDRLEVQLLDPGGRVRYGAPVPELSPMALKALAGTAPGAGYEVDQPLRVPRAALAAAPSAQLVLDYWLTVLEPIAEVALPARHGTARLPEIGSCSADADAGSLSIRCEKPGRAPFCYQAILEGDPLSASAPEALKCWPDYRPYGAMLSALSFYGLDLPLHPDASIPMSARLDPARFAHASVRLRVFGKARHLQRTVGTGDYRVLE